MTSAREPLDVEVLVERHRDGELSLADVAAALHTSTGAPVPLDGSGLNACERGVVEATLVRLSASAKD